MGKPSISKEQIAQLNTLRQKGLSIPEIHRILNISKSTVSRYCKGILILPDFKGRWLERRNASKIISEKHQLLARNKAKELVGGIDNQSMALIAGALYWAEGAKNDFSFTNSDPEMVRVFVLILQKVFGIKKEDFKISIRLYQDVNQEEAINFWSGIIGVNLQNNVSINTLDGKKKGKLKYGMCRVRVKKAGLLLKTIFAINKRVSEYFSL